MTITVLGTGYVGLTTAALLAQSGYKVYAVEINQERLSVIKQGRSFFYEEGLDPIIKKGVDEGTLIPTDSYTESVPRSDIIFSSVGTPDNPDGSSNLSYVFASAKEAAENLKDGSIFVQKSTVPVGTGKQIEELFTEMGKTIKYVSNPEFLREGTALYDTLYFDRVVAGGVDSEAVEAILDVYRELEKHRQAIADLAGVSQKQTTGEYIATKRNSAELIKVTANAFLALKISFANSIALLADQVDADVVEVMDAVGADKRIARAFLNAGRGYGGGCFPKDVSGLIASGHEYGVDLEIMKAATTVNSSMPDYIIGRVDELLSGVSGKKIAVLGLAFKSGTSDSRKSPGIKMANTLVDAGAIVTTYDPEASEEAEPDLHKQVVLAESLDAAIENCDALIIATDWPQIKNMDLDHVREIMSGSVIFDAMNCLDKDKVMAQGFSYTGVGR